MVSAATEGEREERKAEISLKYNTKLLLLLLSFPLFSPLFLPQPLFAAPEEEEEREEKGRGGGDFRKGLSTSWPRRGKRAKNN